MSRCVNPVLGGFVLCFLVFAVPAWAQEEETLDPNTLRVDGDLAKERVERLARDETEGRQSMTQAFRKTTDSVAKELKKWGLEPAGEDGTFFQQVPIDREVGHYVGIPEFQIGGQKYLLQEGDFALHASSTAATSVNAEVVFVGYGISAPDEGLDEYADVNVADKVVLVIKGSPGDVSTKGKESGAQDDAADPWEAYISDKTKIETAFDKGAGAVLLYEPTTSDERSRRYGRRSSQDKDLKFERNFLVCTVHDRILRAIMKPDPQESVRGFGRRFKGMQEDIRQKKACSVDTGIKVRVRGHDRIETFSKEQGNNTARNVLAKIRGTDPKLKREYVIMGAHLDHVGMRMRNGLIYNGADDNASGSALVMEVARVLAQAEFKPKRTIIFACWCGEELGLIGSRHYVKQPCDDVSMDRVVTYFNMDMVGLGDTIGAPGALNFPSIWEVIKRDQDEDVIAAVEPRTGGPGGSDFAPFIELGIEALALMTGSDFRGDHPDYHQPEDDTHKINPEILRKTGQLVLQGAMNVAQETEVNLLIEDRKALYEGMRLSLQKINPDLKDSEWRYVGIDGISQDKLRWRMASIKEKPRKTLEQGIRDLKVFEGDVELLLAASDALGFGRVDIKGSDGEWIKQGRLTRQGRYALDMLQTNNIAVNLVSPSPRLLRAMLNSAVRPFLITGFYRPKQRLYDQIREKKALLGVRFDPKDVDGCVTQLERAKAGLGSSENLVLYVTGSEGLDEAKKALYVSLIKKGWKAEEVGSARNRRRRNSGSGIAGDNLNVLR